MNCEENNFKDSLLANLYATVEFLKNQIEEKDFLIRTLLITEGENYNFMYEDNNSVETISNSTSSESNINRFQIVHNYESQFTDESQINTDVTNIINENSLNDIITENNETLPTSEIDNEIMSHENTIVDNLDNELKEIRLIKHNVFLRDRGIHDVRETPPNVMIFLFLKLKIILMFFQTMAL